mgnify:CR=1 FL=1
MFDFSFGYSNDEELVCPYCGEVQECHEPDVIDACCANTECERCGKVFEYSVTVTRSYSSSKMDDSDENEEEGRED